MEFTRTEIFIFIKSKKILIKIDPTNQKKSLSRNRIRLQLIPYLKYFFNANLESKIIQFIKLLESETKFSNFNIKNKFLFSKKEILFLNISTFNQLPIFLQRKIIFSILSFFNVFDINFDKIETFRLFLFRTIFVKKKTKFLVFKYLKINAQIIPLINSTYIKFF